MTRDARVAGCFALPPAAVEVPIVRHGAGSVLCGKYRLDALLGEGAMGSVWRATNLLLDAPVAIKLIRADLDGGEFRERLQLEARAAAGLGHPAIVRVFDIGETAEGDPFIVMELLRGETLTRMLAAGPLSPVRAAQLVLPVVDALATTHARGIVHRDLKPDNLLIASEAQRVQPKIVDFGIAKLNNGGRDLDESGGLVGSPEYMSPEQANGRDDVDYRTDIWSICVVLYEATAGMMPFSAPTTLSLLRTIIEEEPVPLVHLASVDEQFWDILRTGLAKDRFARHDSMSALGRALAAWLLGQGVTEDVCGTSIEPKWFGETSDPATLRDVVADDGPIDRDASTRPPALRRTLRPKASAHRGFAARILPRMSERRRTRHAAAFACALVAACLVFYLLAPKHGPTSLAAVSHPETSVELSASILTQGAPAVARAATRTDDPIPLVAQAPEESALADSHPTPSDARPRPAITANAPRNPQPVSRTLPAHKAPLRGSDTDLDLIAPY